MSGNDLRYTTCKPEYDRLYARAVFYAIKNRTCDPDDLRTQDANIYHGLLNLTSETSYGYQGFDDIFRDLLADMEDAGIVSSAGPDGSRTVLIPPEDLPVLPFDDFDTTMTYVLPPGSPPRLQQDDLNGGGNPPVDTSGSSAAAIIIDPGGGVPTRPRNDPNSLNVRTGRFYESNELFWNVGGHFVNNCHLDEALPTPKNPIWVLVLPIGTTAADAEEKINEFFNILGINEGERCYHINESTGLSYVATHDRHNHGAPTQDQLDAANAFCSAENIGLHPELDEREHTWYLNIVAEASAERRYGNGAYFPRSTDLQEVHHTPTQSIFHYQRLNNPDYVYGAERHTVTYSQTRLTATKATDHTAEALVEGARNMQRAARANGDASFDSFNIKAEGVDLIITAFAFMAEGLQLNAATEAALKAACNDRALMEKVQALAAGDMYLQRNINALFPPQVPPPGSTPIPLGAPEP